MKCFNNSALQQIWKKSVADEHNVWSCLQWAMEDGISLLKTADLQALQAQNTDNEQRTWLTVTQWCLSGKAYTQLHLSSAAVQI